MFLNCKTQEFNDYLYRGAIFLVVSCPCALVISIPLSIFGGIGASSKQGILIKGGNYLDVIRKTSIVIFDKTGTSRVLQFKIKYLKIMQTYICFFLHLFPKYVVFRYVP